MASFLAFLYTSCLYSCVLFGAQCVIGRCLGPAWCHLVALAPSRTQLDPDFMVDEGGREIDTVSEERTVGNEDESRGGPGDAGTKGK